MSDLRFAMLEESLLLLYLSLIGAVALRLAKQALEQNHRSENVDMEFNLLYNKSLVSLLRFQTY